MRWLSTRSPVLALLLVAGCHYDMDAAPFVGGDRGAALDRAPPGDTTDVWSHPDNKQGSDVKAADGKTADQGCVVGTPDHCSHCGDKCPGKDDGSTRRTCTNSKCNITCRGDYYDVNGKVSDGCEYLDPHSSHGSQNTAKDLGSMDDCSSSLVKTVASLPSDLRFHETAPFTRVLGPVRWYKTYVTDTSACLLDFKLTLDVTALPPGAHYGMDPQFLCDKGKVLLLNSATGKGATKIEMTPIVKCTAGSNDSGTMFVKVRKYSGPTAHSALPFTLTIKP